MDIITLIGLIAGCITTIAYIPQFFKLYKSKHTKDVSLIMYIILNTGLLMWFTYGLLRNDLPVILANLITLIFSIGILVLKIKYK